MFQKSHTCEEGGAHFRISFWHLFMNFEKPKKLELCKNEKNIAGDIILHMCIKNHKHMRYSSWDTEWDKLFLSFWAIFCPLTPPSSNNPENQNFEKMKKTSWDVIMLNLCNKKHDQMMYSYSDMECDRHNFCHFMSFFALLPHYWTQKLNFGKM